MILSQKESIQITRGYIDSVFRGTDSGQLGIPVCKELLFKFEGLKIKLLMQAGETSKVETEFLDSVTMIYDAPLSEHLIDASVLICGAGQTALEAMTAGIPFIASVVSPNQLQNATILKHIGYNSLLEFSPELIASELDRVLADLTPRKHPSNQKNELSKVVSFAIKTCTESVGERYED